MAHLRLGVQPLWLEGIITAEYEQDTLPLIFASNHDFEVYYNALGSKNSRKRFELTRMKELSARARHLRAAGHLPEALQCMQESVAARKEVFQQEDYQVMAAQQHLCLTAVHFASHAFVRQDFVSCYELFKAAKKAATSELAPQERPFVEMLMYSNWVGYWYRRGRPSLAARSSRSAVACLHSVLASMQPQMQDTREAQILASFFYARYGTALLKSKDFANAREWLLKALAAIQRLEDATFSAAAQTTRGTGRRKGVSINAETLNFEAWVSGTSPAGWGVTRASLCITSACKQYNVQWGLIAALRVMITFNVGLAEVYLLKYASGLAYFQRAVDICNQNFADTQCECNEHWWKMIETAHQAVELLHQQTDGKVKRVDHHNAEASGLHSLLMASKPRVATQNNADIKFYRKRMRRQQRLNNTSPPRTHDDDAHGTDGGDHHRQNTAQSGQLTRGREKPSYTSSAAKDDLDDSGDETALMWETLIPCFRKKMPFKKYQEVAREAKVSAVVEPPVDFKKVAQRVLSKQSRVIDGHRRQRKHIREAQRQEYSSGISGGGHAGMDQAATTHDDTATLHEATPLHTVSQPPARYAVKSVLGDATYQSPNSKGYDFAATLKPGSSAPASPPPQNSSLQTGIGVYAKKVPTRQQQQQQRAANRQRVAGFTSDAEPGRGTPDRSAKPRDTPLGHTADTDAILNESILEWYSEHEISHGDDAHDSDSGSVEPCRVAAAQLDSYMAGGGNMAPPAPSPVPGQQRGQHGYCDTSAIAAPGGGGFAVATQSASLVADGGRGSRSLTPSSSKQSRRSLGVPLPGRDGARTAEPVSPEPGEPLGAEMRHRLTGAGLSELELRKLQSTALAPVKKTRPFAGKGKVPPSHDAFFSGVGSVYSSGARGAHQRAGGVWPNDPPVLQKNSLISDVKSAKERQKRLRALLPNLDANGEMYRMVMKELACNTQAMSKIRLRKKLLAAASLSVPQGKISQKTESTAGQSFANIALQIQAASPRAVDAPRPPLLDGDAASAASPTQTINDDPAAVEVAKWLLAATFAVSSQCSEDFITAYETKTIGTHDAIPETPTHPHPDDEPAHVKEEAVPMPPVDEALAAET